MFVRTAEDRLKVNLYTDKELTIVSGPILAFLWVGGAAEQHWGFLEGNNVEDQIRCRKCDLNSALKKRVLI